MGSIGGLLGTAGGASGTGFSPTNPVTGQQISGAYTGTQNALTGQQNLLTALQGQNGIQNQSNVYGQLQNVAAGQGPNPAQAMLSQATGANVANQAALQAGQRGAAQNVGLIARQAAQTGAQAQQQAAGQAATMQANQSLGALGQAGQMANTMAGNQIGQTNANQQAQLAEQQALLQAQAGYNQNQTGLAQTGMQGQQGLIGGVLGGVGGALGLAGGGAVPQHLDSGGVSGDQSAFKGQSKFGQFLSGMASSMPSGGSGGGAQALQQGMTQLGVGIGKKLQGAPNPANQNLAAGQSQFNTMVQPDSTQTVAGPDPSSSPIDMNGPFDTITQGDTEYSAKGGNVGGKLKQGGHVPGAAKVKGDSLKNDVVSAKLSPGEIVIPRSVVNSKDPIKGSAEFVRTILAKKRMKG